MGLGEVSKITNKVGLGAVNDLVGGWQERWYAIKQDKLYEYKKKTSKRAESCIPIIRITNIQTQGETIFQFVSNAFS